jgi:hypothetical protein
MYPLLVFESGLIYDPDVNSRLEAFNKAFAGAIAQLSAKRRNYRL